MIQGATLGRRPMFQFPTLKWKTKNKLHRIEQNLSFQTQIPVKTEIEKG